MADDDERRLELYQELVHTYAEALTKIAAAESGVWGRIAHEALTTGRELVRRG